MIDRSKLSMRGRYGIAVSGAVTWWAVGYPWALLGIGCIVCVSAWIATRNE